MDGVLVAYHNTARIFGFQYIPLEEMEARLYGTGDGARVFTKCLRLLECVLKEVVGVYGRRVGVTFSVVAALTHFNRVFGARSTSGIILTI